MILSGIGLFMTLTGCITLMCKPKNDYSWLLIGFGSIINGVGLYSQVIAK